MGSSRVQDIELAGRRIEFGADDLVATPANDQEGVAGEVGVDRHDVVGERPVETGGRRGNLHGNLLVEIDVFRLHLGQGVAVHGVNERLHVRVEDLRWLGLGADIGQIQTVAANQRRQKLVGEHPLLVVRVFGLSGRQVRSRTEDEGLAVRAVAEVIRAHAIGGKA